MDGDSRSDIAVIGAGIVGICATAYLAEAGRSVVVVDRTGICEETSSGNAAAFAFSDVLPLAQKGMIRNLPKWLFDPLGPLSIPPSYLPHLLPWLLAFLRAGREAEVARIIAVLASLLNRAEAGWMPLIETANAQSLLRRTG
ncbi:MAG: FAD-dependent oxidoreductase, partial [Rhizobiales bacterium]|nr:FAD-dependent oxidoreductase [Hyphomicrobiales bacterium]